MALEALDDLYREVILDHFKNPRHHEPLTVHDVEEEGFNPLCGDQLFVQLKIEQGVIQDIASWGKGCSISQASASILTEILKGKKIEAVERDIQFFKDVMNRRSDLDQQDMGDLEALVGVRNFPVRIKCALLGWTTVEAALKQFKQVEGGRCKKIQS
ncbi:MAG: SUF system NifU family Fe-S cluster assembly protein [Deltaproteobacteria bacterium]|nr:SUF system NifU family Fe-S cluster assembly protein [Deltaproteobacteria bacterium]